MFSCIPGNRPEAIGAYELEDPGDLLSGVQGPECGTGRNPTALRLSSVGPEIRPADVCEAGRVWCPMAAARRSVRPRHPSQTVCSRPYFGPAVIDCAELVIAAATLPRSAGAHSSLVIRTARIESGRPRPGEAHQSVSARCQDRGAQTARSDGSELRAAWPDRSVCRW